MNSKPDSFWNDSQKSGVQPSVPVHKFKHIHLNVHGPNLMEEVVMRNREETFPQFYCYFIYYKPFISLVMTSNKKILGI